MIPVTTPQLTTKRGFWDKGERTIPKIEPIAVISAYIDCITLFMFFGACL